MQRSAGILLHPTCLPSPHGIGDVGPAAHQYLRWLAQTGATWWQVLPLNPPGPGFSPYSATSTFAGSPWLISPEFLIEDGLLQASDIASIPSFPAGRLDVGAALEWKTHLLGRAWDTHKRSPQPHLAQNLATFKELDGWWLEDYVLFAALKEHHGGRAWMSWPEPLAMREPAELDQVRQDLGDEIRRQEFQQFLFFRQWARLREAAAEHSIKILGDLPIFVALDSADVWAQPELFQLDEAKRPRVVAGVPPDYFSETGQLWGNPLYDWDRHAEDGFAWWIARTLHALTLADALRLDHFRGFAAFWEVGAGEKTAVNGRWAPGPGRALFDALQQAIGSLPMVAEDLGEITPDVRALRKNLGLPGMAILHFAFSPEPRSSFIPYNHREDLVVYPGTHDNNTTVGWYESDASEGEKDLVRRYTGADGSEVHWDLIRLAMSSVADTAIVPHQDLFGLGAQARMNTPGLGEGNWCFRLTENMLDPNVAARLRNLVETFGRF
ncbi:MAG: 4-alpha-glucanotransferase [Thermoanaerobaculales bacterium]|nr:4-alpha-glucanotransferase [Thermoanaerobaculales bacterium]